MASSLKLPTWSPWLWATTWPSLGQTELRMDIQHRWKIEKKNEKYFWQIFSTIFFQYFCVKCLFNYSHKHCSLFNKRKYKTEYYINTIVHIILSINHSILQCFFYKNQIFIQYFFNIYPAEFENRSLKGMKYFSFLSNPIFFLSFFSLDRINIAYILLIFLKYYHIILFSFSIWTLTVNNCMLTTNANIFMIFAFFLNIFLQSTRY